MKNLRKFKAETAQKKDETNANYSRRFRFQDIMNFFFSLLSMQGYQTLKQVLFELLSKSCSCRGKRKNKMPNLADLSETEAVFNKKLYKNHYC